MQVVIKRLKMYTQLLIKIQKCGRWKYFAKEITLLRTWRSNVKFFLSVMKNVLR